MPRTAAATARSPLTAGRTKLTVDRRPCAGQGEVS
jgi:hypothetical protein